MSVMIIGIFVQKKDNVLKRNSSVCKNSDGICKWNL